MRTQADACAGGYVGGGGVGKGGNGLATRKIYDKDYRVMALDKLHLRKVLYLMALEPNKRASAIRSDARDTVRRERQPSSGSGGDFHSCFWADAKAFASQDGDLSIMTRQRIDDHPPRERLYTLLHAGFMKWWNERRRWVNEEIIAYPDTVSAPHDFVELGGRIKVENVLALKVGSDGMRLIYPYFSERPSLTPEVAKLGLWLMEQALSGYSVDDMRILDVLRSTSFSTRDYPLTGHEGIVFVERYARIVADWRTLVAEYRMRP